MGSGYLVHNLNVANKVYIYYIQHIEFYEMMDKACNFRVILVDNRQG